MSENEKEEENPLSLLQHASPSRLLYSLMIVENLLDRDIDGGLIDTTAAVLVGQRLAMDEAAGGGGVRTEMMGGDGGVGEPSLRKSYTGYVIMCLALMDDLDVMSSVQ